MAAALVTVSVSANAWWGGGPWNNGGWGDDWFGDGAFDFNISARGRGNGWGRYDDYYGPYGSQGYAPYGYGPVGYAAPGYAAPAQAMDQDQLKKMQEEQQKAMQQAMEAQRKYAEQFVQPQADESFGPGFSPAGHEGGFADPFAPALPQHIKDRIEKSRAGRGSLNDWKARREAGQKQFLERREAAMKEMDQRRKQMFEQVGFGQEPFMQPQFPVSKDL